MRARAAIIALCGLATTSQAASLTLYFAADVSEVNIGDTIHWTVSITHTGLSATGYFGGFVGAFVASNPNAGTVTNFTSFMAGEGTPPTANGASIETINIFNSALLGTDNQSIGVLFAFDLVTDAGFLDGDFGFSYPFIEYTAEGVASLFDSDFIFELPIELTDFEVFSDHVTAPPAPGPLAGLAVGGLILARRRR